MKKKVLSILLASVLTLGLAACGAQNSSNQEEDTTAVEYSTADITESEDGIIYIATSGSPNPFTYQDESGELTGYDVEVIKRVFEKLPQYNTEIEITDWSSIFAGLDSDKYQVAVNNISYNEERAEKYLYSTPLMKSDYILAVREDDDSIQSFSDLSGKTTEVDPDTTYAAQLEKYNEENPDNLIDISYSDEDLLIALQNIQAGKYDFYLVDEPLFSYYNTTYGLGLKAVSFDASEMEEITPPYSYILVSKGNDQLLDDVNTALAELVEDGTIKELSEQFFGVDLTPYEEYK